ncbi:MAG TPA: GNAT family N-acetyltransferase [Anaerolineae bacterium]|nr:GNAT family N-acetyltransferase [Anaerolineae bacterium]
MFMREIRPLRQEDWNEYVRISMNAYPGMRVNTAVEQDRLRNRGQRMNADPTITFYGLFEDGALRGVMRLHDFTMRLHGAEMPVGGVGAVAVDLYHKKRRIAYDLVQFFLDHYRERGAPLAVLYPFRPDFYKEMGFGYGRKMNRYRIKPADLPSGGQRQNVAPLTKRDRHALVACYNRFMAQNNGLMALSDFAVHTFFNSPKLRLAGYWQDGVLRGYLVFRFEPLDEANFLRNNLVVRHLVYETPEALRGLLAFLRSQADQIERIILHTQEEDFHWLLADPRNGRTALMPSVYQETNAQGTGIMYRLIDLPRYFTLLREHNFGGQTVRLKVTLADSFYQVNGGSWLIDFADGRARLLESGDCDVEIRLDVAEFSSLIVGATDFRRLMIYGLAAISDRHYIDTVHRLFYTEKKPLCMSSF